MTTTKTPFKIYPGFLSAKACEEMVDSLAFFTPDYDTDGNPIKMEKMSEGNEEIIYYKIQHIKQELEQHYNIKYKGTERLQFEYFGEGVISEPQCENSQYLRKKWVQTKARDLTGILFLSDYSQDVPFDDDYEVYGGKLEFPTHQFGFLPNRGTLVVFPSGPHFINATAPIISGDLHQVRFHITADSPLIYQPDDFPGNYQTWLSEHM